MSFSFNKKRRRLPFTERLFTRFVVRYYGRNLLVDLQLAAKRSTVEYIQKNMRQAMLMPDRWAVLEFALAAAPRAGSILEFGVERGASIRLLAKRSGRIVHGFDSFLGLPEDWRGTFEQKGKFSQHGKLPRVPSNVRLHPGWFNETLPRFLERETEQVSFIHIDCDIYASTKTVLDLLASRIGPGAIIVFDEYFNYPNWEEHEFRAFQEFVQANGIAYEYLAFSVKNGHVAVKVTAKSKPPA